MKPSEVRDKTSQELVKTINELEEKVFRLRFRKGGGELKQTADIKKTRRDIARAKTFLRERELAGSAKGA